MKKLLVTLSMSAVVIMAAFAISTVTPAPALAQADENTPSENSETSAENEHYTYVAQPGDSYTKMARKAVQTYGIETDVQIGGAGVLFAETNLTSLAGWPALNEGQTVTINKADVKEWFDKAANLSAEEKASWSYYVPFVDFNTNNVGEAPRS